jgi:hypothetical protein
MSEQYSPFLLWVPGLGWSINRPALDRVTVTELETLTRAYRAAAWPPRRRPDRDREPWEES